MSLVITVFVPSGIVMAADSRSTALLTQEREDNGQKIRAEQQLVLSDNAYKVVDLRKVRAGISVYDTAILENQPVESQVRKFEESELTENDDVITTADRFLAHFRSRYPGVGIGFHVGGYRTEGNASVPYVLVGHTSLESVITRANAEANGTLTCGVSRAGDTLVTTRLIDQNFLPMFAAMPLQDAIDYAIHLIRTTIETMRFEMRFPAVGGPIDVLVIKPEGMRWVQRKELHGED